MDINTAVEIGTTQEELLIFNQFTNEDAFDLGNLIVKHGREQNLPIAVSIRLSNGYVVYQHGLTGSHLGNQNWMRRKQNTVNMFAKSSLLAYLTAIKDNEPLEDWGLSKEDYVLCGGGFPVRVKNCGIVACATVSGLPHYQDHSFLVGCISEYLNVSNVPEIIDVKI